MVQIPSFNNTNSRKGPTKSLTSPAFVGYFLTSFDRNIRRDLRTNGKGQRETDEAYKFIVGVKTGENPCGRGGLLSDGLAGDPGRGPWTSQTGSVMSMD